MATDSSILTWEILWTEEPGGLQSVGSQKSGTQLSNQQFHFLSSFTYLPQTTIAKIKEVSFLFCTYSRGVGMCLRRCDASGHCRAAWVPSALCAQGRGHHWVWVRCHCHPTPFRTGASPSPAQRSSEGGKRRHSLVEPGVKSPWAGNSLRAVLQPQANVPHPPRAPLCSAAPSVRTASGLWVHWKSMQWEWWGLFTQLPSVFLVGVCGKHSVVNAKAGLGPGAFAAHQKPGVYSESWTWTQHELPDPDPLFKNSPGSRSSWALPQHFSKEANQQIATGRTQATRWSLSRNGCNRQDEGHRSPVAWRLGESLGAAVHWPFLPLLSPLSASLEASILHSPEGISLSILSHVIELS